MMLALGMLSNAASRSGMFRQAALIVASRRAGRAMFVTPGTHIFAIFLNFGAASLMATLLSQSRDTIVRQNALEEPTLAVLRGFAAMPMWSPLALSTIVALDPAGGRVFQGPAAGDRGGGGYVGRVLSDAGRGPRPEPARVSPSRADQLVLGRVVTLVALLVAVAFALHRLPMLSMPAWVCRCRADLLGQLVGLASLGGRGAAAASRTGRHGRGQHE
ncbi:MAG: hypothetical protein U5L04_04740 [Trueperaceae bacterium]|nr:hypothetical protein [Trueperaceae bacterium]